MRDPSLKYCPGQTIAIVSDEGSKPEVLSRIAQTTAIVSDEGSKPEVLFRPDHSYSIR